MAKGAAGGKNLQIVQETFLGHWLQQMSGPRTSKRLRRYRSTMGSVAQGLGLGLVISM